ncbi:IclR family transcriptional regulator [Corynebacterium atypicum]|uniref:IclR family transcriptional regulator n=1 Tax=Corynebacterium atypicum TaxID=191610 RepID=A0ABM5QNB4_9CORY|nr:IclR family transcriptional regulator [Corynebacterium atypicum]AIG64242.1 IclR family transcriptional regulator [Corynebacterium atypicum]
MGTSRQSGIKVLDRAALILTAVSQQPRTLAELCEATELPRATAHRLATALEVHRLVVRTRDGRWTTGPMLSQLAEGSDTLISAAEPIMENLQRTTHESVQLYRLTGTSRTCIAAREPVAGLNNIVPVGTQMPLSAGSAARVFMAWASEELADTILPTARFTAAELTDVRSSGLSESVSEREVGLASVSAPVFGPTGELTAVLSVSGPADRLQPSPIQAHGDELTQAAQQLSSAL